MESGTDYQIASNFVAYNGLKLERVILNLTVMMR